MLLSEYINTYFGGNQSAFAKSIGRFPQVVHNWIAKDYIVIDRTLYKPARRLPTPMNIRKG